MPTTSPFETMTARVPAEQAQQARKDAKRLRMTPSEYVRAAILRQVANPLTPAEAESFKGMRQSKLDNGANGKAADTGRAKVKRR